VLHRQAKHVCEINNFIIKLMHGEKENVPDKGRGTLCSSLIDGDGIVVNRWPSTIPARNIPSISWWVVKFVPWIKRRFRKSISIPAVQGDPAVSPGAISGWWRWRWWRYSGGG
jgi:hypothetical protein